MIEKKCIELEIHHIADQSIVSMTFNGDTRLILSMDAPPPDGIRTPNWLPRTSVRLSTNTITPRRDGRISLALYNATHLRSEGAVLEPTEQEGIYMSICEPPQFHQWVNLMMGSGGHESGGVPMKPSGVSLFHYGTGGKSLSEFQRKRTRLMSQ